MSRSAALCIFAFSFIFYIDAAPGDVEIEVAGYNYFTLHEGAVVPVDEEGHELKKNLDGETYDASSNVALLGESPPSPNGSYDFSASSERIPLVVEEPIHPSTKPSHRATVYHEDRPHLAVVDKLGPPSQLSSTEETTYYGDDNRPPLVVDDLKPQSYVPLIGATYNEDNNRPRLVVDEPTARSYVASAATTPDYENYHPPRLVVDQPESGHYLHSTGEATYYKKGDRPRLVVKEPKAQSHIPLAKITTYYDSHSRPRLVIDQPEPGTYQHSTKGAAYYEESHRPLLVVDESKRRPYALFSGTTHYKSDHPHSAITKEKLYPYTSLTKKSSSYVPPTAKDAKLRPAHPYGSESNKRGFTNWFKNEEGQRWVTSKAAPGQLPSESRHFVDVTLKESPVSKKKGAPYYVEYSHPRHRRH